MNSLSVVHKYGQTYLVLIVLKLTSYAGGPLTQYDVKEPEVLGRDRLSLLPFPAL